ncbi:MAG: GTPase ObgE [Anaerolineae bacterium]|nr:MAG: GTPase ObgE [Anaerolineae bacterium]
MFIDEARIFGASGSGGDGIVHFRREKYVPRGGPDGGDGGRGGDVVLVLAEKHSTLARFRRRRHFKASAGGRGGPSNRHGKSADDLLVPVPPGTIVMNDETGEIMGELLSPGDQMVVCRGGRGGKGNARYATSRNQAPRMAEKGEPGEELWLRLELRLLADVGIVGLPNAGKSTLLAAVTRAKPKIAEYPFTTLEPYLGVAEIDEEINLVLADIPGLIEGAHTGAGLGAGFLRHISRTRAVIHLVDGSAEDPIADFSQINSELALFDEALGKKPQVVAVNKMDLPEAQGGWAALLARFGAIGITPSPISALARTGLGPVLLEAHRLAQTASPFEGEEPRVYKPEPDGSDFKIGREPDGSWRISGEGIERAAAMTYWEYEEAVRRFQRLLVRIGVNKGLREAGIKAGDTVHIGEYEMEWEE